MFSSSLFTQNCSRTAGESDISVVLPRQPRSLITRLFPMLFCSRSGCLVMPLLRLYRQYKRRHKPLMEICVEPCLSESPATYSSAWKLCQTPRCRACLAIARFSLRAGRATVFGPAHPSGEVLPARRGDAYRRCLRCSRPLPSGNLPLAACRSPLATFVWPRLAVSRNYKLDSFQTGSGQTGSSQKCRNSP